MSVAVVLLLLLLGAGLGWAWTPDKSRTELEAKYAGPPSLFVELDGMRWHVRDSGDRSPGETAPPVLMLHGFGSSLHTWEAWAQALQSDLRVLRVDLPGAGLSSPPPDNDYSDERAVQLLLALLDHLQLPQVQLLGHSMGGRLAWRFAAAHPERVARLVLVAPDGFASPGFEYGKAPEVGWSLRLMRQILPRPVLRMGLAPAYANPKLLQDETVKRYHDLLLAPGNRDAMIARMEQVVLQDPVPMLRTIQAPTLLLWGELDQMIPVKNAQDYLQVMPNARLQVVPGLGHVPHEEAPELGLDGLKQFLLQPMP